MAGSSHDNYFSLSLICSVMAICKLGVSDDMLCDLFKLGNSSLQKNSGYSICFISCSSRTPSPLRSMSLNLETKKSICWGSSIVCLKKSSKLLSDNPEGACLNASLKKSLKTCSEVSICVSIKSRFILFCKRSINFCRSSFEIFPLY